MTVLSMRYLIGFVLMIIGWTIVYSTTNPGEIKKKLTIAAGVFLILIAQLIMN